MEQINWTIENDFQKWIYNFFTLVIFISNFKNWKKKEKIEIKKEDSSSQTHL